MDAVVEYILLSISLLTDRIPGNAIDITYAENEVQWHYKLIVSYKPVSDNQIHAIIRMSYLMHEVNDPAKKEIAFIETENVFRVNRNLPVESKLVALNKFLEITMHNFQGVYAAKTENTPLARILPTALVFKDMEETFKKQFQNEWS